MILFGQLVGLIPLLRHGATDVLVHKRFQLRETVEDMHSITLIYCRITRL